MSFLFSIIIPTYNRAHSIVRAIESVLSQSYQNFEIIIIDDASNDTTEEVVQSFSDTRIKYYKNKTNQERCVSRNIGIEKALGDYICFLDSDDYHLPNHLEVLSNAIIQNKLIEGFYFVNAWNETENGIRTERFCPDFPQSQSFYSYFLHYTVNPQRWCVHRSIFEQVKFDPEVVICEDMDTSLRIVKAGFTIVQIKDRTTVYVAAADSFTHGDPQKWEKELFYLKRIFAKSELIKELPPKETKRLLSMCYFYLSQKAFLAKERLKTLNYAIKSFILFPRGYNGKTNKIIIVSIVYSLPLFFIFRKK